MSKFAQFLADHEAADRIEKRWGEVRRWEEWNKRTLLADYSHLPNIKGTNTRSFVGTKQPAAVTATSWQSCNIPKTASFVSIFCVGAGSGGGGGLTRGAGVASIAAGGPGGGSAAIARGLWMASCLPSQLFLLPGNGGIGGSGSTVAGVVGARSVVADTPNTLGTAANTVIVSGAVAAPGATAGTSSASQAGAVGETISTIVLCGYSPTSMSMFFVAGQQGSANGASGGAGVALVYQASVATLLSGGTGAGTLASASNTDKAGGNITGAGIIPTLLGGAAAAGAGNNGYTLTNPFMSLGGTGGGSAGASGTAGTGGTGGIGCGGGGGGPGVTGGRGGDGGPGWRD